MTSRRLKDLLSRPRQTVATTNATTRQPPPRRATTNATTPKKASEAHNEINDLKLSRVASPRECDNATNDVAAPSSSLGLPPLSPASESRRQKVLALLARDGDQYAVLVEDPASDPVVMALASPDGTCDVLIPRDRYDPIEVLAIVKEWEREAFIRPHEVKP